MGKLTATCFITLDSVVEAPHLWSGDFQSEDTGALNDAVLQEADAMVLGRDTYEGFAAAWPQRSGDRFSDKFNSMPKYVVSTTLQTADWNNSTILDADPFTRVRELGPSRTCSCGAARRWCAACSTRGSSTSSCSSTRRSCSARARSSSPTASAATT